MTTTPTKITITPPSQELFTFPLQDSFEVKCADWKRKKHLALVWVTDTAIVITNRRLKEQRTFFFNKVESFSTDIGLEVFHFRYRPSVKTSGKDIYLFTRQVRVFLSLPRLPVLLLLFLFLVLFLFHLPSSLFHYLSPLPIPLYPALLPASLFLLLLLTPVSFSISFPSSFSSSPSPSLTPSASLFKML
eukprot:TRINITY_DN60_c0_g1_i3.p1 TRINITY_DN60_c0_g1~~TRINITY_DN60_c0_g1_i3.p1  ORF type:complete len:201 (-),score=64.38 TRINITY_DN60_c0_g1_i3:466-1032(-)